MCFKLLYKVPCVVHCNKIRLLCTWGGLREINKIFLRLVSRSRCERSRLLGLGLLVQVLHVILDPFQLGVSTDLLGCFGLEAVVGRQGS